MQRNSCWISVIAVETPVIRGVSQQIGLLVQRHDVKGKADGTKKHAMTDAQNKIEEKK